MALSRYRDNQETGKSDEDSNECDYWCSGPEADESAEGWLKCEKNPGHKRFVPIEKFGIHHLPDMWQKDDYFNYIKVWADLTVRLRVPYGSPALASDAGSHSQGVGEMGIEAGSDTHGFGGTRVGTGYLVSVEPTIGDCPCYICIHKSHPCQRSWTFYFGTAKHVFDDDTEFESVCVDFFHDSTGSVKSGKLRTLRGGVVTFTRSDLDWRQFACVTHDPDLAGKMMHQVCERDRLWEGLRTWMWSLRGCSQQVLTIVSHPHGRPKHITVGDGKLMNWDSGVCSYSVPTCPGCSGARVIGYGGWSDGAHHCKGSEGAGLNKGFWSFRQPGWSYR